MSKKRFALALFVTLMISCSVLPLAAGQSSPVAMARVFITAAANPSATLTPFQPVAFTVTPSVTATPQDTATPTLTPTVFTATPTAWYDGLSIPEGQVRIMLLGTDWRAYSGQRTDVMMLLTLNPSQGTATVLSFPRDLYVSIPGVGMNRLNTAMVYGGFSLLADTLEVNFSVRPDYYMLTNMQNFVSIVDTMGGINVYANQYLYDRCDLPQAYDGYCEVNPGMVTMDGSTALWYVRSRYTSSDLGRTHRAQEVMLAMFQKMLSLDAVIRAPELYDLFASSVETNIPPDLLFSLVQMAPQLLEAGRIRQYFIDAGEVTDWISETGAMVLLPNMPAIQDIITQAVYTP
jgi:polyisoprenyl-teichoic acid--peptidoglycan teichoic acid transferase